MTERKKNIHTYRIHTLTLSTLPQGKYSGQAVELTFRNLSTFYITSTYVPTFIIVVIGYLVFFFPVDDFNERIMVALTALLVEAAFFTQVSWCCLPVLVIVRVVIHCYHSYPHCFILTFQFHFTIAQKNALMTNGTKVFSVMLITNLELVLSLL